MYCNTNLQLRSIETSLWLTCFYYTIHLLEMQHPNVCIAFNLKQHAVVHIEQAVIHFCVYYRHQNSWHIMISYKMISFLIQLMGGSEWMWKIMRIVRAFIFLEVNSVIFSSYALQLIKNWYREIYTVKTQSSWCLLHVTFFRYFKGSSLIKKLTNYPLP